MSEIRKGVTLRNVTPKDLSTEEMRNRERALQQAYEQTDLEEAYLASPLPARLTLTQCMNALGNLQRATPPAKRRRTFTVRIKTKLSAARTMMINIEYDLQLGQQRNQTRHKSRRSLSSSNPMLKPVSL
jgi:hypothetical protein